MSGLRQGRGTFPSFNTPSFLIFSSLPPLQLTSAWALTEAANTTNCGGVRLHSMAHWIQPELTFHKCSCRIELGCQFTNSAILTCTGRGRQACSASSVSCCLHPEASSCCAIQGKGNFFPLPGIMQQHLQCVSLDMNRLQPFCTAQVPGSSPTSCSLHANELHYKFITSL